MSRALSTIEQELQEFHAGTRRGHEIDAHSLGILPDPADLKMQELDRYSRQDLIARHQTHLARLHEGIRLRAVEHAAEIAGYEAHASELGDRIRGLIREKQTAESKLNYTVIAVVVLVCVVSYFATRDIHCPVAPWNWR